MKLIGKLVKWMIIIFVVLVAIGFMLPDNQTAEKGTAVELPAYQLDGPEAYGSPSVGKVGNKYWINVPAGTAESVVQTIVEYELQARKSEKASLGGKNHRITELTFFVYQYKSQPIKAGSEMTDSAYEYTKAGGLRKTM